MISLLCASCGKNIVHTIGGICADCYGQRTVSSNTYQTTSNSWQCPAGTFEIEATPVEEVKECEHTPLSFRDGCDDILKQPEETKEYVDIPLVRKKCSMKECSVCEEKYPIRSHDYSHEFQYRHPEDLGDYLNQEFDNIYKLIQEMKK